MPEELDKYISEISRIKAVRESPDHQHNSKCPRLASKSVEIEASVDSGCEKLGRPMILVSFLGHEKTVRLLLDNGADVNTVDGYFQTPLLAAVAGHHTGIVDLLLDSGAHVC